jgi:glycosyltransferase involved in cell wall biosynthesis
MLRAADLMLLTTEPPESFGIVLIEAMACGLPTIATEYPGVRAVVDPGETGLVVPPRDPQALRAALERLLGDRQPRRRLGTAGRERARERFAWDAVTDATLAAYRMAL